MKKKRIPKGTPNLIDKYVGSRVRARRVGLRLSQTNLGQAIGVTFQQIQKYENGSNRIGASNLFKVANALGVPVSFFFDENAGRHRQGRFGPTRSRVWLKRCPCEFEHDPDEFAGIDRTHAQLLPHLAIRRSASAFSSSSSHWPTPATRTDRSTLAAASRAVPATGQAENKGCARRRRSRRIRCVRFLL